MEANTLTLQHLGTLLRLAIRKLFASGRSVQPEDRGGDASVELAEPLIDVRELIASTSISELNRKAELYFKTLENWDYHLAKPFSAANDAPGLLINFAIMIQGLDLVPGLRVLDFGAGTGWTSRFLSQLGCEVIALDVSETALEIARELYRRQPVIGVRPAPQFLSFDGEGIDLPDASVDRILCFDAFHHATNPDVMLREFARVLRPGGIAAFAEPGPDHSRRPPSQSEMRSYGVIENDVDIHAIWKAASESGFREIKIAAYNVPPFHVNLERYIELLHGGESYLRWAESTRAFLHDVRNFFLRKAGDAPLDSRRREGLKCGLIIEMPNTARAGEPIRVRATVTNQGNAVWLPSSEPFGGVSLACHLFDETGALLAFDHDWHALTHPPDRIEPGTSIDLGYDLPALDPGHYTIEFDCVANHVTWFAQLAPSTVKRSIDVV